MEIRKMNTDDLERICRIEQVCFTDPWTMESFASSLTQDSAELYVIEADQNIAGYACLYKACDEGEIVNVAIAPEYRKRGLGHALVDHILRVGRQEGVSSFYLEVRAGNAAGQALYTGLGFEACGIRKGFYDRPKEDAVVMVLN